MTHEEIILKLIFMISLWAVVWFFYLKCNAWKIPASDIKVVVFFNGIIAVQVLFVAIQLIL